MNDYEKYLAADARLIILRELSNQRGYALNETILSAVLDSFGHKRSRDWLRTQLRKLEELGAISLAEVGSVLVAKINSNGLDHVDMRTTIEGVAQPSPEG